MAEARPKISLVGHSQLSSYLDWDLRIFRGPGSKAYNFFYDSRMSSVLEWELDESILWIGSNDLTENSTVSGVVEDIVGIVEAIEGDCGANVSVCQIEPRKYPSEYPLSHQEYRKIQRGINQRLRRVLENFSFLSFNST